MTKKKTTNQSVDVTTKVFKATIKESEILPINKKGDHDGPYDYSVDKITVPGKPPVYLSSKQKYDKNGNKVGKPVVEVHRNISQVGKRFPRISPALKRLK
jgi:hypothetical protein